MDPAVRDRVKNIHWYHSMQFGDVVTRGDIDIGHEEWVLSALPKELTGKAVLDVGAWDGFYSFEAERRGARRVLAIDSLSGWHGEVGTAGFDFAKAFYRSNVEFKILNVMDVDQLAESFDVALFLGVYYHLRDPQRALRLLFERLRPQGEIVIEGSVVGGGHSELLQTPDIDVNSPEYHSRCLPTVAWLEQALRNVGFERVEVVDGTWRLMSSVAHNTGDNVVRRLIVAGGNQLLWTARIRHLPWRTGKDRLKTFRVLMKARRP